MSLVSLIIPNYNKAAFLTESLGSILNQTYKTWEAIVLDDGSTDNSLQVINKFVKQDNRFKLIALPKQKNGGSVCRNIGLKEAKGDYIIFFDSDDLLEPFCLEHRVKFLDENQNLDFAVFPMNTFKHKRGDHDFVWQPIKDYALEKFLSHELPWQTMQPIYNRSFLIDNKLLFDENFSRMQDVEFHTGVLLMKPKFTVVNTPPDCFFRVGLERKVMNSYEFHQNWSMSVIKFIRKFHDKNFSNLLGVTAIYGISEIVNAYRSKQLTKTQVNTFAAAICDSLYGYQKLVIRWYLKFSLFLPFHLPGHRAFFKLIMTKFF